MIVKRDPNESLSLSHHGCRASIVHPIETVRRLPNLLQRLFLMKQNLLISVPISIHLNIAELLRRTITKLPSALPGTTAGNVIVISAVL